METKDFIIYNGIANAARRLFDHVICNAGEFGAADIAKKIFNGVYFEDNFYNGDEYNEITTVEFDGYKCTFKFCDAFSICAQIETAWQIPSARRVRFIRENETAAPVVCFDVPAAAKDIIKCIPTKFDNLRPVMNYVCVDTRRRALITGASQILCAVAVPDMYVSQDAKETYLIDPNLLKAGKGTIIIDANGAAVNGAKIGARVDEYAAAQRFPSWETVLPAVADSQKIELSGDAWKQLKKEIAAAAKYSDNSDKHVQISGRAQDAKIIVTYIRMYETAGKETARDVAINLPQPCPFDFSVRVNGKLFAAAPAADSLYIYKNTKQFSCICTAAAGAVCYLLNLDDDKDVNAAAVPAVDPEETDAPALLQRAAFPELSAANTPAAVAAFDAINAPAAVPEETRPSWENSLPAAAVKIGNVYICGAPQDEETDAPQDETTPAPVAVPQDEETDAPAVAVSEAPDATNAPAADSVPAVDETTPQTPANVETAAPVAAVPEETPAPVCLPAVCVPADSLYYYYSNGFITLHEYLTNAFAAKDHAAPVVWYAVYNSENVLHGVYFSQLLADELVINSLFAAGPTWHAVPVADPNDAPAVDTRAAAVPQDEETPAPVAVDEETETAAPVAAVPEETPAADSVPAFASAFACIPEIWETPAPVAVDEYDDAPAVAVSLPQDEETAAAAFDYQTPRRARRLRLRPWLIRAAAVVALIVCAAVASWERPAPVAAADSLTAFASAFVDETANSAPQDETTNDAPAVAVSEAPDAPAVAVADSVPAAAKKRPRRARKQPQPAPVAVADSLTAFAAVPADSVPAVAVADSVPAVAADSLTAFASAFVADSIETAPAVPADSVPAVAVADSIETAAPVAAPQDEETAPADSVPAVDETDAPQDETTPAAVPEETDDDETDGAPAGNAANSVPASNGNAPAVPAAASGTPAPAVFGAITAAPVWIITL